MDHPILRSIVDSHGVFLRREARELGYHDTTFERMRRSGEIRRVRWGCYTMPDEWDTADRAGRYALLCRAAVRRAQTDVVLSHLSSANELEAPLWDLPLDEAHLTRRDGRSGRRQAGVCQHRGRIEADDVVRLNGLDVMGATRTVLEITSITDVEHALVVADDLLHRGLTTKEQLFSRYERLADWPHTLATDLTLRLADGASESVGETRCRYLCWTQHLPAPIANYEIRDHNGVVLYRVDLAWPALGLYVEFDGREKYLRSRRENESVADAVERERRRENHINELTGWRCLRLVWADLAHPRNTADRIRRLFRTGA